MNGVTMTSHEPSSVIKAAADLDLRRQKQIAEQRASIDRLLISLGEKNEELSVLRDQLRVEQEHVTVLRAQKEALMIDVQELLNKIDGIEGREVVWEKRFHKLAGLVQASHLDTARAMMTE